MSERIQDLLKQISELEAQLRTAVHEQEEKISYRLEGTRVRFDDAVSDAHRRLKTGVLSWLARSSARNIASAPFIYSMIVPIALFDLSLSLYQAVCFRLYGIPRVRRADFVVIDRHHLGYLNAIEKLNCVYCGYGNGVISYAREVISRTEQYWCPIKHARKVIDAHPRYAAFIPYGDASEHPLKVKDLRNSLREEESPDTTTVR